MPASKYTPEQKAEALKIHEERGPAEAARQTGIPKNTIASWAKRAGVQTVAAAATAAAVEMAKLTREQKRESFRDELLEGAIKRLRSMDDEMSVVTNAAGNVVQIPVTPQGQQQLSQAVKNLVETFRLEVGESTSRPETGGPDQIAAMLVGARTAFDLVEASATADK